MNEIRKLFLLCALSVVVLFVTPALAAETIKKIAAVAKKPALVLPGEPAQLDFVFDKANDIKGWLRDNGDIYIEGYLNHNHLRCGTYELGIQFGKGNGCVNVEWLTEPKYVSHKRQCNQAVLHHRGNQKVPEIVPHFKDVTCGQLLIRCEGTCGLGAAPRAPGVFDKPLE
jgi:hypothetical protein